MKGRLDWIDLAKGIAIILVVIGHVGASYNSANIYSHETFLSILTKIIYSFHMPLFIFISGYLFSLKKIQNQSIEVIKILINYGVPYIFFSVLWIIFKFVFSSFINTTIDIKQILFIFVTPVSFMWYLYAIMIMEIIQIFITKFTNEKSFKLIHCAISAVMILLVHYYSSASVSFFSETMSISDFIISDIFKYYLYFLIGLYFGKSLVNIIQKNLKSYFIISTFGVVTMIVCKIMNYNNILILNIFFAYVGILFIICVSIHLNKNLILNYIGKNTLPIYLLQGFIIAIVRIFNTKIGFNDVLGIIPLIDCTLFSLLMPIVIYQIFYRIKFIDFLFYPGKYIDYKKIN